jgi:CubicO group peptidase (beta-lactamase class C family)
MQVEKYSIVSYAKPIGVARSGKSIRRDRSVARSFVRETLSDGVVEGYCREEWRPLLSVFLENFRSRNELGASCCVRVRGETVIDVWGGIASAETKEPWKKDTVVVVFSATKGATAICAHILASRGLLDLNQPIREIWPEFAKKGKESATVAMTLNHSVGVPGFREKLKPGAFADWDYMIHRIEEEQAFWEPGVRCGYHMLNIGWTAGELIRRVSGKSLGTFFRDEVAKPLGLDFWIGLPESEESRVARFEPHVPSSDDPNLTDLQRTLLDAPQTDFARAVLNAGGYEPARFDKIARRYVPDTRLAHAAEIGGSGGITNARGLAGLYDPLANGGGGLVSADHVWRMSQTSMVASIDPILMMPTRYALGYMKSMDNRHRRLGAIESVILGDRAFGHVGAGGSLGFADPDCELSFGYAMNRMGPGILLNERGQSLVDATYKLLGYRSNASGVWAR